LALAFALLPVVARADDAPASVDSLVAKLTDLRKQRAALDKAEAEVRAALKAELKRITDLVAKLDPDAPPVVPPDVKPKPVDPLAAKVRDAVKDSVGTDAEKRKQCLDLAALYRAAGKLVTDSAQFPDADSLLTRLRQAAVQMLGDPDALREVRKLVAGELAAVLPTVADAPLTDAHRAGAVRVFERLAEILEETGK
jgi:hypothetical protein